MEISKTLLSAMDGQQIALIAVVVVLLVALIVLPMITNKKRQKQVQDLHNSIRVGDTVKTVGGVVGTIVAINEISPVEREFVLETGLEGRKATMAFDFNAIYQVMSRGSAPAPEPAPAETVAAEEVPAEPAPETEPAAEVKAEEVPAAEGNKKGKKK